MTSLLLFYKENGVDDLKVEFASNINSVNFDWLQNALNEAKRKLLNQ